LSACKDGKLTDVSAWLRSCLTRELKIIRQCHSNNTVSSLSDLQDSLVDSLKRQLSVSIHVLIFSRPYWRARYSVASICLSSWYYYAYGPISL